ncbi:hypothetical protein [Neorhizobium galegae]|uniref:hypothetical protein n=1 Tax=Neorhizobium galegae TaxID=399 RepID=UPI002102BED1|nr:hypothetical protein [Neorhizobium galegae]MCQ1833678.1 hypothetical protein [Neorhizobium galegae]UIY30518.1 hypothetical protein LZK73_08160 [Neorhizobium galegae]
MTDESDLDATAPKRRRATKADAVTPIAEAPKGRSLQSHGKNSKVYVPVILKLFQDRWRPGASTVVFSLDDVRTAVEAVRAMSVNPDSISSRNPADVIYRMRSRTKLPDEILAKGFHVLRAVGRGRYQFEKASSGIMEVPITDLTSAIDQTPMPVRRLLPETMAEMDEQALLSIVGYCQLLDHFTGMKIYRLRSHVRKSVPGIGQAELDAIDVGIASGDDDTPVIFPIEAKAVSDELNRVQIFNMIQYAAHYFPGLKVRPLALKVDYQSAVHLMEFNLAARPGDLRIIRNASYVINTSEAQLAMIRATNVPKQ